MAKGPTFDTITAAFASASLLNANFAAITTSFDNTISRDGSTPNQMLADFDLNSNDILNAGTVNALDIIINGLSLQAQLDAAAASATASANSATAAASSASAAAASADIVATLTEFTNLTDTPASYSGQAGNFLKVNAGATAVEFVAGSASEPSDGDKGDITVTASGLTWSIDVGVVGNTEIANDAVTYAKIQNVVANNVILGNNSGVGGIVDELTATEVTALLNTFTSALKGLVPSSGGGTTNFLRADGTFATPASTDSFSSALLHLQDQQASGADGGTFTSGAWRTRILNTEVTDEIGSTLASNQFTLPAGTYWAEAEAPARTVSLHKLRLRNITDSSDILIGSTQRADSANSTHNAGFLRGRFTLAGTKTIELQHQCSVTRTTDGFGEAAGFSVIEIYADIRIWKVS